MLRVIHWLLRVVVSASELLHNSLNGNFKAAGWLFCMLLCISRANQTVDCQTAHCILEAGMEDPYGDMEPN